MDEILKGNFKVKKAIQLPQEEADQKSSLQEELKKRALASLGGSMVYVERDRLNWDGEK